MTQIMIHNTHGKDDVERASLAFVVANVARSSNQAATVLLTIDGVWVATKGYAEGLQAKGFAPLNDLVQQLLENEGRIWVCGACAKPRDIVFTGNAGCHFDKAAGKTEVKRPQRIFASPCKEILQPREQHKLSYRIFERTFSAVH